MNDEGQVLYEKAILKTIMNGAKHETPYEKVRVKAQNGDEDDYWGGDLEGWEIEPFDLTRTNQRLSKLKEYLAGVDA